jgi:ATP-dependent NAD(P)H-hydrate dehydratase
MVQEVTSKIERLHVLVIGPGLGRCPLVCEATARIIQHAMKQNLALVLDADALWMLALPKYRSLLGEYTKVVLTPNVVEYKRLFYENDPNSSSNSQPPLLLKHATVVQKGHVDVILRNGQTLMECQQVGGKKRSGGIGDVLAGTIGTLVAWENILSSSTRQSSPHYDNTEESSLALSCWTACCFVKRATQLAFQDKKRSMTAPDVLEKLGIAIDEMTSKEEDLDETSNPPEKAQETSKL